MKRNPRDIPWTVLYRRKHKKVRHFRTSFWVTIQGLHADDNTTKKRIKRTVQVASRAIGDFSIEAILAKRNQNPEFRKNQREQAVKAAKDAARAQKVKKDKAKPVSRFPLFLRHIRTKCCYFCCIRCRMIATSSCRVVRFYFVFPFTKFFVRIDRQTPTRFQSIRFHHHFQEKVKAPAAQKTKAAKNVKAAKPQVGGKR